MSLSPAWVGKWALTSCHLPLSCLGGKPDAGGQHANRGGPEPKLSTSCVTKGKECRSSEWNLHNWYGKPCIRNIWINNAFPHLRLWVLGTIGVRPDQNLNWPPQVPTAHSETFLRSRSAVVVGLLLLFLFCFVLSLFFFISHLIFIYFYAFIFKYIYFIFFQFPQYVFIILLFPLGFDLLFNYILPWSIFTSLMFCIFFLLSSSCFGFYFFSFDCMDVVVLCFLCFYFSLFSAFDLILLLCFC